MDFKPTLLQKVGKTLRNAVGVSVLACITTVSSGSKRGYAIERPLYRWPVLLSKSSEQILY